MIAGRLQEKHMELGSFLRLTKITICLKVNKLINEPKIVIFLKQCLSW